eukprot:5881471-Alexandrium_andersonii.AAC.1
MKHQGQRGHVATPYLQSRALRSPALPPRAEGHEQVQRRRGLPLPIIANGDVQHGLVRLGTRHCLPRHDLVSDHKVNAQAPSAGIADDAKGRAA